MTLAEITWSDHSLGTQVSIVLAVLTYLGVCILVVTAILRLVRAAGEADDPPPPVL